eukprot:3733077-Amphidinium_carterae.1
MTCQFPSFTAYKAQPYAHKCAMSTASQLWTRCAIGHISTRSQQDAHNIQCTFSVLPPSHRLQHRVGRASPDEAIFITGTLLAMPRKVQVLTLEKYSMN